jgi:hypothetical protein
MPPKKNDQKKGINYKPAVPTKDIVPVNIK